MTGVQTCALPIWCKESGNFLELLDLYSPDGAKSLDKLREQQYKHGGIV